MSTLLSKYFRNAIARCRIAAIIAPSVGPARPEKGSPKKGIP
jgi:hypothetical protein